VTTAWKAPGGNRGISVTYPRARARGFLKPHVACDRPPTRQETPGGNRGIGLGVDAASADGPVRSLPLAACMGVANTWKAPGGNRGISVTYPRARARGFLKPHGACDRPPARQETPGASRGIALGVDAASAVPPVRSLPLAACMGVANTKKAPGGNRGIIVTYPRARARGFLKPHVACDRPPARQETPGASRGIGLGVDAA
jgi:hypothetical protein